MLFSEGKPSDSQAKEFQVPKATQTESEQKRDYEQIFQIIEAILSFEACLYHQILPFRLEDKNLLLGMVNPQDTVALDYVNSILSYLNCTMVKMPIAAETHRTILSAYLNHKNTFGASAKQVHQPQSADVTPQNHKTIFFETAYPQTQQKQDSLTKADSSLNQNPDTLSKNTDNSQPLVPTPSLNREKLTSHSKQAGTSDAALFARLPIVPVPTPELLNPVEMIATFPPKKLLEELLGRVLAGGIGRLYLERQPYEGRILWSENGVLQSVLEKLPLSVFQGVLNELKRFTNLPVATFAEPRQVERECVYQQNRLLLRLRVIPGVYGEEATLQVLRGAALKFYQQQQLVRLSRDALGISQQLSYKLHELQQRLVVNRSVNSGQIEAFATLNQLVENLDHQIKILSVNSTPSTDTK